MSVQRRICLDASRVVTGLASPASPAAELFRLILAGEHVLVTSPDIEQEYRSLVTKRSVRRLFERRGVQLQEALNVLADLRRVASLIVPEGDPPLCRDPNDAMYLHCALAGEADFVITGMRSFSNYRPGIRSRS